MNQYFIHKKTNNVYVLIGYGINANNGESEGKQMAIYRNVNEREALKFFVRDKDEFLEKFREV